MSSITSTSDSTSALAAWRSAGVGIHLLTSAPPVWFAAEQLATYLPALLGESKVEIYLGAPGPALAAAGLTDVKLPSPDAILIQGDGSRYVVAGETPAATLHAAYAFLEALGARWLRPGPSGEVLRPLSGSPPALSIMSEPAFRGRGITEGCLSWWPARAPFEEWLAETIALVDWMGKMRMNRLLVHFNRLPPGDLSSLLPELEKRGIALELGGHALPKLIPAALREREPELCRVSGGVRRTDANFCTSSSRALALAADGSRHYVESLPPADVYHFWSYDAKEDPWCSCPSCAALGDAGQMWRAVAAAARGVGEVRPSARVSSLLYHESIEAAATAPEWAFTTFAPRERCYLHPIDGECPRNERYASRLRSAIELQGARLSVLEYYGDPILLGRPANRPGLVAADLQAYRQFGVDSISCLVFGALSSWLYPLQMYAYARAVWDPEAAVNAADDYALAAAPSDYDTLLRCFRLADEAAGTHLRFCRYGEDGSWVTLPFPPPQPDIETNLHIADLARGRLLLEEARTLVEGLPADNPVLSSIRSSHRLEEAFHRAVLGEMIASMGRDHNGHGHAFGESAAAVEAAPPDERGVFGTHWMLPWLLRCAATGRSAPV